MAAMTNEKLIESADDFYYAGDYSQAISLYDQVLGVAPQNEHAQTYLAKSRFRLVAQQAEPRLPAEARQYFRRAYSYIAAGDSESAFMALRKAIEVAHQANVPFREAEDLLLRQYDSFKNSKKTKVFISYSRHDLSFATDLYWFLRENECNPWMDIYDLIPGQDWQLEIHHNIKTADFFIACLSQNSVSTHGYVQKELKDAISILEQIPEGEIYIIPIRIDDCIVPTSLASKHWLEWKSTASKAALMKAIRSKK
jgi:tetratricopeptide (TPR) repeat protein